MHKHISNSCLQHICSCLNDQSKSHGQAQSHCGRALLKNKSTKDTKKKLLWPFLQSPLGTHYDSNTDLFTVFKIRPRTGAIIWLVLLRICWSQKECYLHVKWIHQWSTQLLKKTKDSWWFNSKNGRNLYLNREALLSSNKRKQMFSSSHLNSGRS